ncbi:MAG: PAS domain S-box protein, partial [Thermoflexales bacterium]|nr:PAS domain S-box protein [Thermoflexales bacterium]
FILSVAVLVPLIVNIASMFTLSPLPSFDLTPMALVISCLMFGAVLFRFRLVDLVPIARTAVIENMPDGMLVLDTRDHIIDCNPALVRLLGVSRDNLVGQSIEVVLRDQRELFDQYRHQSEGQGELTLNDRRYELRISPLTDRPGSPAGRLIVLRDVSARYRAEEALRRSQAQLSGIIDTAQDAIITLDADQRIVMFNVGAERLFGCRAAEVLGQTVERFVPDYARARHAQHIRAFAQTGVTTRTMGAGHVTALRANGEEFPTEASISRVTVDGQDFFTVILRDITQRERADRELRLQKQLFENLVAVARTTSEKPDLDDTLRNVLRVSVGLTEAVRGSLFLFDADGIVTHTASVRDNDPIDLRRAVIGRVMSQGLVGWVARNRRPGLVTDTAQDERWLIMESEQIPTRSALAVPIVSGQVLLGALILMHAERGHFTEAHVQLMQAAADQMALAVRNARTYDLQRRLAKQQTTLYEVLRTIGVKLDRDGVARTAAETITLLAGWPNLAIILPDDDGSHWVVRAVSGMLPMTIGLAHPIGQGIIGRAFTSGKLQHVANVQDDADHLFPESNTRSKLVVPMRRGQRVLGVLNIDSQYVSAFDSNDISLAQSLAEAVALALDNALLYQTIANERSQLQAIIESSRDGIVLISMTQRILVINDPALRLLGMPGKSAQWSGHSVRAAMRYQRRLAPQALSAIRQEMKRILIGDEPSGSGEYQIGTATVVWYNLPVTTENVAAGRLVVLRDVSEERSLSDLREDLTSTMVHDLRNPLTVIQSALELLEMDAGSQPQVLPIMRQGLQRMLNLVTSILDVNRLESGQMPLEREPTLLTSFVDEALAVQKVLADEKDLRLHNDLNGALPPVTIDTELISRVLQNLIGNAIKFTPSGGDIRVSAHQDAADARRVVVSVSDTGPGLPAEVQSRLFQKFVRGAGPGRGSGLGLAFCRLAIEAHGGRIWADSAPEQGTAFHFTLPVSTAD